jgi:hypothetical protein
MAVDNKKWRKKYCDREDSNLEPVTHTCYTVTTSPLHYTSTLGMAAAILCHNGFSATGSREGINQGKLSALKCGEAASKP